MSEEKCSKCNELKSVCKCSKDSNTEIKEINVKVDNSGMENLIKRLSEKEKEAERLAKELEESKKLNESTNQSFNETKQKEKEHEIALKKIETDNFNSQRDILLAQAKEYIKDPEKLKKIEESIKDTQSLQATKTSMEILFDNIKQGQKEHEEIMKKEKEEMDKKLKEQEGGTGTIPLTTEMKEKEMNDYAKVKGYDSHKDMIRDLRRKQHSDNPQEAALASSQLSDLLGKWAFAAKANFDGRIPQTELGPKDIKEQPSLREITKKGGEAI
jgi:hypothetical protein